MVVTVKLPVFCMNNISEWGLPCKGQQQDNGSNYSLKVTACYVTETITISDMLLAYLTFPTFL